MFAGNHPHPPPGNGLQAGGCGVRSPLKFEFNGPGAEADLHLISILSENKLKQSCPLNSNSRVWGVSLHLNSNLSEHGAKQTNFPLNSNPNESNPEVSGIVRRRSWQSSVVFAMSGFWI
jgi:hypothetical protein